MNKIDEMIKKLCPNGVECKKLKTISKIIRGERITKRDLNENGKYIAISGGTKPFGKINKYNRVKNTITIAQYGTAGYVDFQLEPFWANDVVYSLFPKNEIINNKFLYYYLVNIQDYIFSLTTKALPNHLPIEKLNDIKIPIPPLEVQNEIVRILNKYTELERELERELGLEQNNMNTIGINYYWIKKMLNENQLMKY